MKMADNKIARELLDKIDVFEHTHIARHIPRSAEISLKYFENSGLSCKYFLDLDEVFIKNKRKVLKFCTPDPDHIFMTYLGNILMRKPVWLELVLLIT